jgi:hypothetical protein
MSAIQALGAAALSVFTSNWMVTIFCWKRPNRRPTPSLTHYRGTRRTSYASCAQQRMARHRITGISCSRSVQPLPSLPAG